VLLRSTRPRPGKSVELQSENAAAALSDRNDGQQGFSAAIRVYSRSSAVKNRIGSTSVRGACPS